MPTLNVAEDNEDRPQHEGEASSHIFTEGRGCPLCSVHLMSAITDGERGLGTQQRDKKGL